MKVITFRSEDDSKNTVTPRLDLRRLRGPVFELVIEPKSLLIRRKRGYWWQAAVMRMRFRKFVVNMNELFGHL